jgi:hypothetical protein
VAVAIGVSAPTARKAFAGIATDSPGALFAAAEVEAPPSPAPEKPRRKHRAAGGRPQAKRNDTDASRVALWSAGNVPQRIIAERLSISEPTLRRLYADELDHGPAMKRAEMLERLERTARGGNVTAQKALLEIIGRTEEDRLAAQFQGKGASPSQEKAKAPVGKKEQAMAEADDAAATGAFAGLLEPATHPRH